MKNKMLVVAAFGACCLVGALSLVSCGDGTPITQAEAKVKATAIQAKENDSSFVWPSNEIHVSVNESYTVSAALASSLSLPATSGTLSQTIDYVASPFSLKTTQNASIVSDGSTQAQSATDVYTFENDVYYVSVDGAARQALVSSNFVSYLASLVSSMKQTSISMISSVVSIYASLDLAASSTGLSVNQAYSTGDGNLKIDIEGSGLSAVSDSAVAAAASSSAKLVIVFDNYLFSSADVSATGLAGDGTTVASVSEKISLSMK